MPGSQSYRYLTVVEGVVFSAFIGLYIWRLQQSHPSSWLVFPIWLVISFVANRDTPKTLGWRADNLWAATRQGLTVFGAVIAGLFVAGLFLGALSRLPAPLIDRHRFFGY